MNGGIDLKKRLESFILFRRPFVFLVRRHEVNSPFAFTPPPTRRGAPVWRSFWRIRFAGPVFRFGQNPVFGVCFGLAVSDMRVRTIFCRYRNEPTPAF